MSLLNPYPYSEKCDLNFCPDLMVYAPTADSDDEEVESFYKKIDDVMKLTKNKDVTLLLDDMNAKIGQGSCGKCIGRYGLSERNERGDRLLKYCQENSMIITNTYFKLPKRRLYTWKSPRDSENRIVRNQIDYIILNQRYRNAVKSVKSYPAADVGSDHSLLVTEIMVKLKKLKVLSNQISIDTSLLRSNNAKVKVYQEQYIETPFNDQREEITTNTNNEMGASILKEEVQAAIKGAKDGKAPGPDDLPADALKLIEEQN
ncbi:craniofacial development protein 2-like [Sitophilus oryzae]|uniref:Craniofacial development protein 2-like n=1 Tax=Sitophilus oryzae TaxID=7048 RepID=A0A6J2XP86_SITOR|nr:craniofacial development protein 2-like [Sitophilus oryzae]